MNSLIKVPKLIITSPIVTSNNKDCEDLIYILGHTLNIYVNNLPKTPDKDEIKTMFMVNTMMAFSLARECDHLDLDLDM